MGSQSTLRKKSSDGNVIRLERVITYAGATPRSTRSLYVTLAVVVVLALLYFLLR